jgi:PKD repeat protein
MGPMRVLNRTLGLAWALVAAGCGGGGAGETTAMTTAAASETSADSGTAATSMATTAPTSAGTSAGNVPPVAEIGADKLAGPPPLAVQFSAAGSSDADGQVVGWLWDFGDGAAGEGAEVGHVYAAPGSYKATLTVTDDDGAKAEASATVMVGGCPAYKAGAAAVDLDAAALLEASGLAFSRQSPGVLWTHNDSDPDGPRVYAFATATGALLGTYTLQGAEVKDWEDMALGPGPVADKQYLYVGDIGDNNTDRNSVKVYRAPEPPIDVDQAGVMAAIGGVEALSFTYPGGARDSESLLVDPVSGDLFLVTKVVGASAGVFRAAAPLQSGALEHVADADLGAMGLATGGSVSAAGDWVVVRSYFSARMWSRPQGMPLAQAFLSTPCTVPLAMEIQGEAIAFAAEGLTYYTVSEGETPPLFRFDSP